MAAKKSTRPRRPNGHTFVRVPGHPRVTALVTMLSQGTLSVLWCGSAGDLMATGVVGHRWMLQRRRSWTNRYGHEYSCCPARPGSRAGKRYMRYNFRCTLPEQAAMSLPGVPEALARLREHCDRLRPLLEKKRSLLEVPVLELIEQARPLAEVLCSSGDSQERDREVGRHRRRVRWIVNGNLIAPNWRDVRAA